jgi:hypothetical protein
MSEESKHKMSVSMTGGKNHNYGKPSTMKGRKHTEETKRKISYIAKQNNKGENNPMYGKKHSNESKKLMSSKKPKKPVLQYDLNENFICEYESVRE